MASRQVASRLSWPVHPLSRDAMLCSGRLPSLLHTLRARLNRFDALYGLGSVFNHSCRPNARRLTDEAEHVSFLS